MENQMRNSVLLFKLSIFLLILFTSASSLRASEGKILQAYQFFPAEFLPNFKEGEDLSGSAQKYFAMDPRILENTKAERSTATIWIKGSLFRIDPEGTGEVKSIIFKSARDSIVILDHKEKTSLELSVDDLSKMRRGLKDNFQAETAGRESETRTNAGGKKSELTKLGKSKVINGHRCEGYAFSSAREISELWITEEGKELFKSFRDWGRSMSKLTRMKGLDETFIGKLDVMDGFPILLKTLPSSGYSVMEIKSIDERPVPDDLFQAPAAYRKESYEDMVNEMMKAMEEFFQGTEGKDE